MPRSVSKATQISRSSSKPSSLAENVHWTARSTEDFVSRITFDFALQIEHSLSTNKENQAALAGKLGLTEGRVSQTLNNPASMSLKTIVKYARAIGKKVAVVLYDDDDYANNSGPVNSEIFYRAWESIGRPRDFFELETATTARTIRYIVVSPMPVRLNGSTTRYWDNALHSAPWQTTFLGFPSSTSGEVRGIESRAQAIELRQGI